jgi:subtilisin family serine protease
LKPTRSILSRLFVLGCAFVLVLETMLMGLTATTEAAPATQLVDNGEVVIVLRDGIDPVKAARQMGIKPTYIYRSVFSGFAGKLPAASVATANRSSLVDLISPNTPVEATRQPVPTGVRRIVAHDARPIPGKKARNVGVAVLDSGIQARQAPPRRKKRPNFRAKDLNVQGGTTCIGKGSPLIDRNGHGTHVAGTIGARNNNYGAVGVAPGVALYAVKVLDDRGIGTMASVICGLDWVAKQPGRIDVVNLSLAGRGNPSTCASNALHRAVCRVVNQKGISVVVASGNDGQPAANFIPANFQEVITVSAFADSNGVPGGGGPACGGQADDTYASFSNYGPEVDIIAPGVCIRSTRTRGGTSVMTGTSMAAPHVTGALALYYAQHPRMKQLAARNWLLNVASVEQNEPGGLVDAFSHPDSTEPVLWLDNIRP